MIRAFYLLTCLTVFALMAAPAQAQTPWSVTYYGTGCTLPGYPSPDIEIHAKYPPKLGGTFVIMYKGMNGYDLFKTTRPVLMAGLQKVDVALPKGPPIPGANLTLQPSNCRMYVTPDVLTYMPRDPAWYHNYDSFMAVQVPNNANLIGFTFYLQWAAITINGEYGEMRAVCLGNRAEIIVGV